MGAVNVRIHRREAICKTFCNKALSCEVITFVEMRATELLKDGWVTLQTANATGCGQDMSQAGQSMCLILESYSAHKPMDLISKIKKILGQITPILSCDTGN